MRTATINCGLMARSSPASAAASGPSRNLRHAHAFDDVLARCSMLVLAQHGHDERQLLGGSACTASPAGTTASVLSFLRRRDAGSGEVLPATGQAGMSRIAGS